MSASLPVKRLVSLVVIVLAAVALRLYGPAELFPPLLIQYGYWAFWAAALYFLASLLMPARPQKQILVIAALVCALVEISKISHLTTLDIFRLTPVGDWILGRDFSFLNFLAYAFGLDLAWGLDALLSRPRRKSRARRR